jgi:D-alanyl-D-alanine carboxypeptidase
MEPNFYGPIEDIPEAQRDGPSPGTKVGLRKVRRWLVWFAVGLLSAIAGLVVSWLTYAVPATPVAMQPMVRFPAGDANANSLVGVAPSRRQLLGHLAYEEVATDQLVSLRSHAHILLRPTAAEKFEAMVSAAAQQGIYLVPISGFRTEADQQYLFFEIKAERGQDPMTRAEVSAPPGYSEHHTGYAIDIGDADVPDADLTVAFEDTAAFTWLADNAPRYNFELSFPEDNDQGVQYEPWHWRFVGDPESLETFYQAR